MKSCSIYLCGVGGQGIGLLTEVLLRGGDHAGLQAKAVDTHGLAQRGGIVISHLRFGDTVHSPLIPDRRADLVVALERHEALRGADRALKDGGTLIYFNTSLQPLGVRLGTENEVSEEQIEDYCQTRGISCYTVACDTLDDSRMQNIALLAHIVKYRLVPQLEKEHVLQAMEDLLTGENLQRNLDLFNSF